MKRRDLKDGDCFWYVFEKIPVVADSARHVVKHILPLRWGTSPGIADYMDKDVELLEHYSTHPTPTLKTPPVPPKVPGIFYGVRPGGMAAAGAITAAKMTPAAPPNANADKASRILPAFTLVVQTVDGLSIPACLARYESAMRTEKGSIRKDTKSGRPYVINSSGMILNVEQTAAAQAEWSRQLKLRVAADDIRERDSVRVDRDFEDWE